MHLLIGFAVLVGLVAFAFGERTAVNVVRTTLGFVALSVLAGLAWFAVDVLHTPQEITLIPASEFYAARGATSLTLQPAKIPENTSELRRICAEWLTHPNDAPRMCFAVLERMEKDYSEILFGPSGRRGMP